MKRCPRCSNTILYGDSKTTCPFCHSRLIINNVDGAVAAHIRTPDAALIDIQTQPHHREGAAFLNENWRYMTCHGRVTEMDSHEVFNSSLNKILHAIFQDEPYQFAHQTAEYTIRVAPLDEEYPSRVMDFCLYGNYMGRLQIGDEITIKARNHGSRNIVKQIYNHTSASQIKPGLQIPAIVVRLFAAYIMIVIIAIIMQIINFAMWVGSGAAATAVSAFVASIMPCIIIVGAIVWLLRCCVNDRHRHW